MTIPQIEIFAILAAMLALFLWDRLRFDVVALLALLAAVFLGVVPMDHAFSGFSNPVLPLIAGALAVSAAVGNSGVIEAIVRRLAPRLRSPNLQVGALVGIVAALSAFIKNIGALAILMPVALQLAERNRRSGSEFLMPLAFGSLIGGLATLIGTSPNVLIAAMRAPLMGAPFRMFDFAPVGVPLAFCGTVFLAFGWRLLPRNRKPRAAPETLFTLADYVAEIAVPEGSPMLGRTIGDVERLSDGALSVIALLRGGSRRPHPVRQTTLKEGDVLVVESDPHVLDGVVAEGRLAVVGGEGETAGRAGTGEVDIGIVEAIVTENSALVRASPAQLQLRARHGIDLLAVSRRGRRVTTRLGRLRFSAGDVVVLRGEARAIADSLAGLGCLPLAPRNLRLGLSRQVIAPFLVLAAAVVAAASGIVTAEIAFVAAATVLAVARITTLREIYDAIEWPILVLLGALIPVGEAVRHTGATELIAGWLSAAANNLPAGASLALVMVITMLATPLLHHAAAVIVIGPVAVNLAHRLGLNVDPFLMAVAVGAGSDFLSPIGHQCNTLVLGVGGYRFGDYWRLGLPLSLIVVVVGVPLIMVFWPLH